MTVHGQPIFGFCWRGRRQTRRAHWALSDERKPDETHERRCGSSTSCTTSSKNSRKERERVQRTKHVHFDISFNSKSSLQTHSLGTANHNDTCQVDRSRR